MKINRGVISAVLGFALLAVPITASAHTRDNARYRGRVAAFRHMEAFRPAFAPRANFAGREAGLGRFWTAQNAPLATAPYRGYYGTAANYAPVAGANCPIPQAYNSYPSNYYPQAYNSAAPYYAAPNYAAPLAAMAAPLAGYGAPLTGYGAPMGGGLASLINQRNSAQLLYQQAARNGNHTRAKHLLNDVIGLNKQIAGAEQRSGQSRYNTIGYNTYAPSALNNGYGYGGNNGFTSMLAPMLGNYIH